MKTWFEKMYGEPAPVKIRVEEKKVDPVEVIEPVQKEKRKRKPYAPRKRKPIQPAGHYDHAKAAEYLKSLK